MQQLHFELAKTSTKDARKLAHPQLNLNFILASKRQRHVNVGRGELKRVYKLFSANDTKVKLIGQSEMRRKGRTHSKQNKKLYLQNINNQERLIKL